GRARLVDDGDEPSSPARPLPLRAFEDELLVTTDLPDDADQLPTLATKRVELGGEPPDVGGTGDAVPVVPAGERLEVLGAVGLGKTVRVRRRGVDDPRTEDQVLPLLPPGDVEVAGGEKDRESDEQGQEVTCAYRASAAPSTAGCRSVTGGCSGRGPSHRNSTTNSLPSQVMVVSASCS